MGLSNRRRTRREHGVALAAAVGLHAVVLTALAWPVIESFPDRSNDEDAIDLMLQRERRAAGPVAAPDATGPRPGPVLAPAVETNALGLAPVAAAPPAPATGPGPGKAPTDLRALLRGSGLGCSNSHDLGLDREARDRCDERLGAQARNAQPLPAPIDPGKRRGFEAQALRQQADRAYLDAPMGIGVDHRSREGPGTMKDIPWVGGAEQDGLGRPMSATQQRLKHLRDADKAEALHKATAREADQR